MYKPKILGYKLERESAFPDFPRSHTAMVVALLSETCHLPGTLPSYLGNS